MKSLAVVVAVCLAVFVGSSGQGDQTVRILEAVRRGDLAEVASIVGDEPNQIEAIDTIGYTPLHLSAAYARWDILELLLEAGAAVNVQALDHTTPLHAASAYDDAAAVDMLLSGGADSSLAVRDLYGGYTPLLRGAQRGSLRVVLLLLERGADPSAATTEGWTALHLAALGGHPDLFDILIAKGVPPEALDDSGRTYQECIMVRPSSVPIDRVKFDDYVGTYSPFLTVFVDDDRLWLDDHSLNELYPIGEDAFFCVQSPWKVVFLRDADGNVISVELTFLRRSVVVEKTS